MDSEKCNGLINIETQQIFPYVIDWSAVQKVSVRVDQMTQNHTEYSHCVYSAHNIFFIYYTSLCMHRKQKIKHAKLIEYPIDDDIIIESRYILTFAATRMHWNYSGRDRTIGAIRFE